ncbi:hypothetical protein AN478_05270 [Thiohalorhabdus denitrificans]|uniref:DUF2970 domain-containing protein n=1 Tax=Thiohalorhabdus denitrificans TaxID=381306 RepID=A0A0P9EE01_9GAMM|nr:DUF2970 domain-containing protein [Thiohalorhabdus denitrificans]KPV40590.1 hypothetical protein AN478_05270 [Thiohalorhabdus denitrificans]SCY50311.1 Protein of unknown function [Thiohalorhabdus denitrificans]
MEESRKRPSLPQVIGSVLAAMFGVQSRRNQERDFGSGRAAPYIVAGLVMTLLFVLAIWSVVQLVLGLAA